jgi:hypothetical protein
VQHRSSTICRYIAIILGMSRLFMIIFIPGIEADALSVFGTVTGQPYAALRPQTAVTSLASEASATSAERDVIRSEIRLWSGIFAL